MKIFYAIQATGNGHISRAMEIMPYLQQYGKVDVFLSGSNSHLQPDLPVRYRSAGVSLFYGNKGGLDYWRMWKELNIRRIWQEARTLPVEQYDIVLNDFESITSLACRLKQVPSLGFGHQASFQSSKTPRAKRFDPAGELVLKHYAPASANLGLHFRSYDKDIYSPVIKQEIVEATPTDKGHITVYLSHYSDEVVLQSLQQIPDVLFEVFSKKVKEPVQVKNCRLLPISNQGFTQSLIHAHGVITGAGFETPAEALYLAKKLLVLPIRGQYEQWCNAAAVQSFGVPVVEKMDAIFPAQVQNWLAGPEPEKLVLTHNTYELVQMAVEKARSIAKGPAITESLLTEEDLLALF